LPRASPAQVHLNRLEGCSFSSSLSPCVCWGGFGNGPQACRGRPLAPSQRAPSPRATSPACAPTRTLHRVGGPNIQNSLSGIPEFSKNAQGHVPISGGGSRTDWGSGALRLSGHRYHTVCPRAIFLWARAWLCSHAALSIGTWSRTQCMSRHPGKGGAVPVRYIGARQDKGRRGPL